MTRQYKSPPRPGAAPPSGRKLVQPRQAALACMLELTKHDLLVPEAMDRLPLALSEEDLRFAHELVYGTFRYLPGLKQILARYCKKVPPPVRWILLLSLYQLCYMRVPDYAVLDEANKLTVQWRVSGLKGLVNGVLRKALREDVAGNARLTDAQWLLPEWLAELLTDQYGQAAVSSWVTSWQKRPTLSYWSTQGEVLAGDSVSDLLPHARLANRAIPLETMKAKGIYVQNESSQALAEMVLRLNPQSILDTCAAPGGKACYLASFGKVTHLLALDPDARRLHLLKANQSRLGLTFETGSSPDAASHPDEGYDLVLVDAPCSGLGIIGRHPEIKFLKQGPADSTLRDTQQTILDTAWQYTRPGGHLLYAVCSLDRNELPTPPQSAQPLSDDKATVFFAGMPCIRRERDFYFPPSERLDGFSAMILHKP